MYIAAYLSYTDQTRGIEDVEAAYGYVDEVCPSWWAPDSAADGTIVLQEDGVTSEDTTFISDALAAGKVVRPVLANYYGSATGWDWTPVSTIINNASLRSTLTANAVSLCQTKGYHGLDLDFEQADDATDRDAFTTFVTELAAGLHAAGLTLSIFVHPKEYEPGPGTKNKVQDYEALGAVVDQFRVGIYDYDPDSGEAAQSPYTWWQRVAPFACSLVSRHKILFGAPTYGYDWNVATNAWTDYMWEEVEATRVAESATASLDATEKEETFQYDDEGTTREVWYHDATSLSPRAALAKQYGVQGMSFWRAGGEDPTLWAAVDSAFNDQTADYAMTFTGTPSKDCFIDAFDTDNHTGTGTTINVKASAERRVLLQFSTSTIPAGALVSSVTLRLYREGFFGTDPEGRTYYVDQLTDNTWVETTSGQGAAGATWSHAVYSSSAWTSAGGDYTTDNQASATVPADDEWMEWDVLSMFNARADPDLFGVVVRDSLTASNHQTVFTSKEGTAAQRPQLVVVYTTPQSLLLLGLG